MPRRVQFVTLVWVYAALTPAWPAREFTRRAKAWPLNPLAAMSRARA
ncbi:hypothetical protein ACFYPT_42310 [Streptomyces sp. NPDC005529]